jgi:hypothetical protein
MDFVSLIRTQQKTKKVHPYSHFCIPGKVILSGKFLELEFLGDPFVSGLSFLLFPYQGSREASDRWFPNMLAICYKHYPCPQGTNNPAGKKMDRWKHE